MQKRATAARAVNEQAEGLLSAKTENAAHRPFFGKYAVELHDNDWPVIPVKPATKEPFPSRWPKYSQRPPGQKTIDHWLGTCADCSIGIVCGRIIAIDIDVLDRDLAQRLAGLVVAAFGHTPLTRIGQAPKAIYVYQTDEPIRTRRLAIEGGKVEVLGAGAQFVAYGIHPITRRPYQWEECGEPLDTPVSSLPKVTAEAVEQFLEAVQRLFRGIQPGARRRSGTSRNCEIVYDARSRRIVDGREKHLRAIVLAHCREAPGTDPRLLETAIWDEFRATTDLSRHKDSGQPYSRVDVRTKVRSTLRKIATGGIKRAQRTRFKRPPKQAPAISAEAVEAFRYLVASNVTADRSGRRSDHLTPAAATVSSFMLDRLQDGQCSDSANYIARGTGLAQITVKKARRTLVRSGFWMRARQLSREHTAPYWPDPAKVHQALEQKHIPGGRVY